NIYRIIQQYENPMQVRKVPCIPGKVATQFKDDFPEILELTFYVEEKGLPVKYENEIYYEDRHIYAEKNMFKIFKVEAVKGSLEDAISRPNTAVMTESIAEKYFGSHEPLGKIIQIGEYDYEITAVIKDSPSNTHIKLGIIASVNTRPEHREWLRDWEGWAFKAYIRLEPGVKKEDFEKKIKMYIHETAGDNNISQGTERTLFLENISDIHQNTDVEFSTEPPGKRLYIYIFSVVGILILLIACLNFINLSTARSLNRSKEVGVRKSVGANRKNLIKQFYMESIFLTMIASVISIIIISISLPYFNSISGKDLSISWYDTKFVIFFFSLIIITGIFSGSYPSLYLSGFNPAGILRENTSSSGGRDSIRKILVIFQFAISIGLIISTLMVYRQLDFMKNQDLGFDKEQKLVLKFPRLTLTEGRAEVIKNEFLSHSSVKNAAASSGVPGLTIGQDDFWLTEDPYNKQIMLNLNIDHDYIPLFNIQMAAGTNFPESMRLEDRRTHGFIINETAAYALGFKLPEEAIGKTAGYYGVPIIGVTKDFHYTGLQTKVEPALMSLSAVFFYTITLNIETGDLDNTISFIESKFKEFNPEYPFDFFFLDNRFDMQYRTEEQMMTIIGVFTLLGITIACLGLFGLASFTIENRIKEIGIRKALGASVPEIVFLLSKEFIKWVVVANIIAVPVSTLVINRWLEDFPFRISVDWRVFVIAGLSTILIALITVSYQSVRAAYSNPVDSIKYE
ncbi:MAG: FtsX-like permease family protein, partial [bacterium]|nr:FtsX-like permease family protein [bacterium]